MGPEEYQCPCPTYCLGGEGSGTPPASSGLWVSLPPLCHAIFVLHNRPPYTIKMSLSLCLSLCLGLGEVPDWGSYFSTVGDSATQSPSLEVSRSLTEPVICHCGEEDMGLQDRTLSPSVWLWQPRVKLTQERPKAWLSSLHDLR